MARQAPTAATVPAGLRNPRAELWHIEACLTQPVEYIKGTGLEGFELTNQALPEVSLGDTGASAPLALPGFVEDPVSELCVRAVAACDLCASIRSVDSGS